MCRPTMGRPSRMHNDLSKLYYGVGLAIPFGVDGKFRITLKVGPHIGKQDCRRVSCAIVTRADHTNSEFRGADVLIPVTFTNK